jgi:multiple sugar transport system permease protein
MRRTACIALILAFCLLGPSCGRSAAEGHKELIVWNAFLGQGLIAALRQFEEEHPGWVVVTSSGVGAGNMDPQKLMCGIAGGSPPDMLSQDRFSVGEWASRDAFLALDDFVQDSLRQEAWAQGVRDALAAGDLARARQSLTPLMSALERLGPGRRLSLAAAIREGMSEQRSLEDLTPLADELAALCQGVHPERFYEVCWQEASYGQGDERRVYAIPNGTDDRLLFYNDDLLERAGPPCVDENGKAKPPANWDELKAYALKLTERDANGKITRLGFAPNYGNSWLYIYGWLNGGAFMTPDGRTCTLNDPKVLGALKYMVEVYDALGGMEQVGAFQSTFQTGEFNSFFIGKVAMKIDGNYILSSIAEHAPNLRFTVAPAPPGPKGDKPITWSGGYSWAIPVGSKNPEMAFELIRFLMTDRVWRLEGLVNSRYMASRGRCYVPEMAPLLHINQMRYDLLVRDNPDLPPRIKKGFLVCADMMKDSRFRPVTPVGQFLWDEQARAFEKAVRHTYTPEEALERGRRRVQDQLDLIYKARVNPPVNWNYPMAVVGFLALAGAVLSYFCFGRGGLVRRMVRHESLAGWMFVSPWFLGFVVLTAGPIVVSIIFSFCRYDVVRPAEFVGLENYRRLLSDDPLFWKALANTVFMMLGVPLGMAVGLAVAMLLNTKVRGMQIYRTIFFLPAIVPAVASSILWIWVLNPEAGLLNSVLRMLGWSNPPRWLQSSSWLLGSKTAIIMMGLWGAGAGMIIWLAGLKGIPQHLYEAAEIDGANRFRKFVHVTLPMLSPYIFFNLIMGIIGTLQIFTQAYIMTSGGPDDSTLFYVYYLFNNAFRYFNMGYASALAWILFAIILVLTLIQLKLAPRWVHYET